MEVTARRGLEVGRGEIVSDGWIVTNVEILGGKPCVKGTRLSVESLLELAASGAIHAETLARYPQLTAEGLSAAFLFAAANLELDRRGHPGPQSRDA